MDNIIIIGALSFLIVFLYTKWLAHEITFLITGLVLLVTNQISSSDFLSGFSNENVLVILMLLSLGELLRQNHFLQFLLNRVYGKIKNQRSFIGVTTLFIGSLSAFFNNTPLVAIMMPYVNSWSVKNKVSPSKLYIPLSYIAILGGCITLVGTSTNLVVNGILKDNNQAEIAFFDFTLIGVSMLLIGGLYLLVFSKFLLPKSTEHTFSDIEKDTRNYLVNAKISQGSNLSGKSIQDGGLRNLKGLFLVKVIREDKEFSPVHPSFILNQNDLLVFAGDTENIKNLVRNKELKLSQEDLLDNATRSEMIEVVISPNSFLVGNTLKSSKFRSTYNAAAIAVHRNGEKISGKIGEIELKAGDVLILLTGNQFEERAFKTTDFYTISKVDDIRNYSSTESLIIAGGAICAILLGALGIFSLFKSLLVLFALIILLKIAKPSEVYNSLNLKLGVIIALSLSIGKAIINSSIPQEITQTLLSINSDFGVITLQGIIYLTTAILAALVTSKAAVAIMIPIGITLAAKLNLDPSPFFLIIAFASAANFITPHGYQTNLMVMQVGNYKYRDFLLVGFPLTILYMAITLLILNL